MNEVVPKQFAAADNARFFCLVTWSGYRSSSIDLQGVQHLLLPDSDDAALGRATLDALAHSRFLPPTKFGPAASSVPNSAS